MEIEQTGLEGLLLITPKRFGDHRGWFTESWNKSRMEEAGIFVDFVQDNRSFSTALGTLRGLHFQAPPFAQTKLVQCVRGALLDVAVDARVGSPTFGAWRAVELSAQNGAQLLVPEGYLHGFVTLLPDTEIHYKCSAYYAPDADGAVFWNSLGINWAGVTDPILSDKDSQAPKFNEWNSPFVYEGPQ